MATYDDRYKAAKLALTPAQGQTTVSLTNPAAIQSLLDDLTTGWAGEQKKLTAANTTLKEKEDELAKFATLDCSGSSEIELFLANNAHLSFEKRYQELSSRVRASILNGAPDKRPALLETTVSEELTYWRKAGENDPERKHDMRVLTSIADFEGTSESEWRAFEYPWIVAIRNRNVLEHDLKTVLYQKLKKSAATFYLSIPAIETMGFGEVMQKLREQYTSDTLTALNRISGMTQKPGEKVTNFVARMTVEAKGCMPKAPAELVALVIGDKRYVLPNPLREEDKLAFSEKLEQAQAKLTNSLLRGLRPDITSRMTSAKYTTFEQVKQAAENAEWMNQSINTGMIHTLEVGVNAMNLGGRNKFNKNRNQFQKKNDACFRCGKGGHWASECKVHMPPVATLEQAHYQRSKPAFNRGKFSPRDKGHFRGKSRHRSRKSGQNLPWNPRDPQRRKWMVRRRVALNRRMRNRRVNYHLTGESAEESFSNDEIALAKLEDQLGSDEYEQYMLEVEDFDKTLGDFDYSDDDSKN
jgi:hypothetical protein